MIRSNDAPPQKGAISVFLIPYRSPYRSKVQVAQAQHPTACYNPMYKATLRVSAPDRRGSQHGSRAAAAYHVVRAVLPQPTFLKLNTVLGGTHSSDHAVAGHDWRRYAFLKRIFATAATVSLRVNTFPLGFLACSLTFLLLVYCTLVELNQ